MENVLDTTEFDTAPVEAEAPVGKKTCLENCTTCPVLTLITAYRSNLSMKELQKAEHGAERRLKGVEKPQDEYTRTLRQKWNTLFMYKQRVQICDKMNGEAPRVLHRIDGTEINLAEETTAEMATYH